MKTYEYNDQTYYVSARRPEEDDLGLVEIRVCKEADAPPAGILTVLDNRHFTPAGQEVTDGFSTLLTFSEYSLPDETFSAKELFAIAFLLLKEGGAETVTWTTSKQENAVVLEEQGFRLVNTFTGGWYPVYTYEYNF